MDFLRLQQRLQGNGARTVTPAASPTRGSRTIYKNNSQGCEAYDPFNWFGTCQDQCPIAYSVGSSAADAQFRLLNERYNLTFLDPANVNWYWYMYYENCDPVGENRFGTAD